MILSVLAGVFLVWGATWRQRLIPSAMQSLIESLYLLTQIQKNAPDKVTTQKIAEHKFAAEAILNILRPYYEKSPEFKDLIDEIVDICYEFDGIDFNYTYKEPTTYPNKHLTVINSESSLNVYPEHIKLISEKIEKLRKNVVQ